MSEHGSASTPCLATGHLSHLAGGSLADRRRGVVSRRASLTAGGVSALDDDRPITKRVVSRRTSLSGMAVPLATQSPNGSGASAPLDDDRPMTKRAASRRASLSGGMAIPLATQSPNRSGASAPLDDDRPMAKRAASRRASLSGTILPPATQSPQMKKRPSRSRSIQRQRSDGKSVCSKPEKSAPQETKSSDKKGRGRSQSVQRSSKSTDKAKSSERKSPKRSFGKTSDLPPETRASDRKGRGRSQSAHRSRKCSGNSESKSSGKPTSALPPETQAPDKKARARSKSTRQRTSKTTKEQARRTYEFNKFETDHATKCEVEASEKTHAESALGRRRERSQSVSHRRPSTLPGLGKATSTPQAEAQSLTANSSIQTEKISLHSKDVSTFGTDSETGGFPTDDSKDSSGARKTSAPADFPAHAAWDDDPWADDDGFFNLKAATVTITKVEMTSIVPADPNNLFRSEIRGSESTVTHSQGGGSTSSHNRSGSPDLGSAHNRGSGSGGGRSRRSSLTLTEHMKPSFGGKVSDTVSVSGHSRYNIQGIRRSHSSQGPTASTGKRAPPPTVAVLFAEKLKDAKKLDQARNASQRPLKTDSDPGADSGQVAENLEAANKLDEIRKISQRLIMADSGQDQTRSGSQRPLKENSGRGIAADSLAFCTEMCEDAKKLHEIRKVSRSPGKADSRLDLGSNEGMPSCAPHPSANAFAAKLQAARQHDDSMSVSDTVSTEPTASISSTSSRRSSMSSGSSSSRLPRRQSTEMGLHSPRPENIAKKVNGLRSGRKQLRRGSSMV